LLNKYGLRHLSAIGITEQTDAVVLVVSEERGTVSFVKEGKITENLRTDHLVELLNAEFAKEMLNI
jgi:DNA integrity scanning protein DisA with diadenylate cyclase activity